MNTQVKKIVVHLRKRKKNKRDNSMLIKDFNLDKGQDNKKEPKDAQLPERYFILPLLL